MAWRWPTPAAAPSSAAASTRVQSRYPNLARRTTRSRTCPHGHPKTDYNGVLADPAAFAKKVRVLWLGVGTAEPEGMRAGIRKLHALLTDAGIAHVYQEAPGTDHEWQTWRRNLNDFAARLFR